MSYLNLNELAASNAFRGRVQAALAVYASTVLEESVEPAAQAQKRRELAELVLTDPAIKVNAVVWSVVTNPVVQAEGMDADDGALQYIVGQTWDRLAGVTEADRTAG